MSLSFRGSVNRWECDENDHLNVRFCEEKLWQTLTVGLLDAGIVQDEAAQNLTASLRCQHIRFQSESRVADPLSGYFYAVSAPWAGSERAFLAELVNERSGDVACTMIAEFEGLDGPWSAIERDSKELAHALPRGLSEELDLFDLNLNQARERGFQIIGKGLAEPAHCDINGHLLPHLYMGYISDAVPHLWRLLDPEQHTSTVDGGVVVEFRRRYRGLLLGGHRYVIASGVAEYGPKLLRFVHCLFDVSTDRCVAVGQAMALRMDLSTRRSIPLTEAQQAHLANVKLQL
ncbi:MAG TPA: hypothetical protein DCP57_01155 [Gammaproteobacteria bacterium]|jgi:acyl-CoA thioester hydrolase|nr:MAG: hypothetical protein EVA67_06795 [OM182 bacterium]HAL41020.1 hypothetical protein [Gammaproteobacteria bacterium]HBK18418.1 hypothetical protein [Gammaproteobacteria bacterium]|tara:strand:- start:10775 stop:11641 length:867 start_codon:yes stop_codon:yes gene_type:complete